MGDTAVSRALVEAHFAQGRAATPVDRALRLDSQVMLVDEFTGRMMEGRRLSEGLHQAIEAKEGVDIKPENQTLASITFQNYFRLYDKLAGMTGTAITEAGEFHKIYKLDVVSIPTHLPNVRIDGNDVVYRTEREKWVAIVNEIEAGFRAAAERLGQRADTH
mgnify:CR=1 FL=1